MTEESKIKTRELMRIMILSHLYVRAPAEYSDDRLVPEFCSEFSGIFDRREVTAALAFLVDAGFVVCRFKPLGASRWYRITAEGVLIMEREYPMLIPSTPADHGDAEPKSE